MEKKIATSVNVRINVGNYQHIEITKCAEQNIAYESEKEMTAKEDKLTDSVVADILRTIRSIPDKLGKKTNAVEELEESVKKEIPRWLTEGGEPNLASGKTSVAEKKHQDVISDKKAEIDNKKKAASTDVEEVMSKEDSAKPQKEEAAKVEEDKVTEEDIFGEVGEDGKDNLF